MNDLQLMYMINGDLTATSSNVSSTVDLMGYTRAAQDPMRLAFVLGSTPVGGTALSFTLQESDTVDFTTPKKSTTFGPYPTTEAGILASILMPVTQRYTRVVLTKAGTFTAGTLHIYIMGNEEFGWKQLEDARIV